ncbi:MAG: hypothetical protein JNL98_09575 [Bryobacterales bacterium]|nr:hypothetical protein [Bryobacterales bacterium]
MEASRIELRNLQKEAVRQLEEAGTPAAKISAVGELVAELAADDEFWRYQSESLAVFVTPESIQSFRLPNHFDSGVEVSDRFHVAPLVRAVSFPYLAYVLALSQNSVRLVEITPSTAVDVTREAGIPENLPDALGRSLPRDPAPAGRLQGGEGQKVLVGQFARRVDAAVCAYLTGGNLPLILAAVEHVGAIYRSHNSCPNLLPDSLTGNFDHTTPAELAAAARPLLDAEYQRQAAESAAGFAKAQSSGYGIADLASAARAATQGAVRKLCIDIETVEHGTVDDDGAIAFAGAPSAASYDIVGEIAVRALLSGAEVIGLRKAQMPAASPVAAILRYLPQA